MTGETLRVVAYLLLVALAGSLAWFYLKTRKALLLIKKHLEALSQNDFSYRSPNGKDAVAGQLNKISDRFNQFESRSQTEMSVIVAEAKRLQQVINSIDDGVIALDKDAHIILFNKAAGKITGFNIEEAAGTPLAQTAPFIRGDDLVVNEWLAGLEGEALARQRWEDVRLKAKDGKTHAIDLEALYQGADPNGVRALLTFHDRTPEQEVEDMKIDFVALAAHELRTPVTVIRGYLEILDNEMTDQLSAEQREFMRKLNVSASQLSGFINNILHVSRIEHGNLNLQLEASDWVSLVKNACIELATKAEVQGKSLILDIPDQLPEVAVDRMSIVEVINNLVDNAIKYSQPGTVIKVHVTQNGNQIETTVTDKGVGIPTNAIGNLFTKFYRSHSTRSSHRGTGLGLYMSKSIVEAHGGSIWVRSVEGQGSTFGFLLPVYDKLTHKHLVVAHNNKIVRGVHGWIKNHSLYRG